MSRKKASSKCNRKNNNITVVLPTVTLRLLCDHAESLGLPQGPTAKFWQDVDEEGTHVVSFNFPGTGVVDHGNGKQSVRAMVMCKMRGHIQPQLLLCDFDYTAFSKIVRRSSKVRSRGRKVAASQ
jgi:hypothetical protein